MFGMMRRQIIEKLIDETKSDKISWRIIRLCRSDDDIYEAMACNGDIRIRFEGELVFNNIPNDSSFCISIEAMDHFGLGDVLEKEIISSIDRQVPEWVVACLD